MGIIIHEGGNHLIIMKTLFCIILLSVFLGAASIQADIVLGAPGVPIGTQVATKVPFKHSLTLVNSYKFVFVGIEAQGNTAGAPGSSGTNGNGGQFHVSATVSDNSPTPKEKVGKIEFRDVGDFNSCPLKTMLNNPTAVFRATTTPINVTLQWAGEGNAKKPDGIFNILGEYQKAPPVPTGNLNFAVGDWMLVTTNGNQQPQSVVTITRE